MPERDPAITPVCRACGAEAVIPDAFLVAKGYGSIQVQVGLNTRPGAVMLKKPVSVDAEVRVCGECGDVQVRASDPLTLWNAHLDRLSDSWS